MEQPEPGAGGGTVVGWKLDPRERAELLARFPPRWPDTVADHVTLRSGTGPETPLPTEEAGAVIGWTDDGEGLQALVVAIGGSTARADGSTYHITWSLDRDAGRRPVESNRVLAERGWHRIEKPVPIRLRPARF